MGHKSLSPRGRGRSDEHRACCRAGLPGNYLCSNFAGRFSTNAAMPSFWSTVANSE